MRLYLVQHGEAVSAGIDPNRPLTDRGREDLRRLAAHLERCGVLAARVVHSGRTRAAQSAELLAVGMTGSGADAMDGLGPKDPVEPLAKQAATWTDDTVIVGHLPQLTQLTSRLLTGDPERLVVVYEPGTMVCLRLDAGRWALAWVLPPELTRWRTETTDI